MFKNLLIYKFKEQFTLTSDELENKLESNRFSPCGSHNEFSLGWTAPVSEELVHSCSGFMMLCLNREEKVIPPAVINEMLQERISEIEEKEARKLAKKERATIRDELIFELLPRAFSLSRKTYAYIDPKGGWIAVDAASTNKAEELLSYLRKCLGSLAVVPISTEQSPSVVMTEWLLARHKTPENLIINDECELKSIEDVSSIAKFKHHDLFSHEVTSHLESGNQVVKLAVTWLDRLSFIIDEKLAVKRLKFLDVIQDQISDIETKTKEERFDADFSIIALEIASFIPELIKMFGGEKQCSSR